MRTLPVLLLLVACDEAYHMVPVDDAGSDGAAWLVEEDAAAHVRRETFTLGGGSDTAVADYLFVVDNSTSMRKVIGKVRKGFASLDTDDPFPPKARLAFTSTLPAGEDGKLHPAVRRSRALHKDPGFAKLVDAGGIAAYRKRAPERAADRFALNGCDPWFAPGATNADGESCIAAHTQLGLTAVDAEAGLTALGQLLDGNPRLFRPGAAVNVVFVSDTHDPGLTVVRSEADEALEANRPSPEALAARVPHAAAFRLHAIAPATECVEAWEHLGPSYYEAAEATGGVTADVCATDDYAAVIRRIAGLGAVPTEPVVPLGRVAAEVIEVTLDGRRVDHSLVDGTVLRLDDLPEDVVEVEVLYRYEPLD